MGTVFRGIYKETKTPVAIKILASALAEDINFQNRFMKEIEALRQLKHPNIVRLLGYGREEMCFYYAMELVNGRSFEEEIRSGRSFGWRETLSYAIQIASALNCAHVHGIIHRDLKPANLMLTSNGIVKLSDFGIATLFGSDKITSVGSVVGTINYMAPEQAAAQPVTTRTDLYAFGAVLVALLTGHPPYSASTLPEIIHQHATSPARRPSQMGIDLPVEFDELIGRLLERNPEKRPKNAYFVQRLLEAMQEELTGTNVTHSSNPSAVSPLSTDILQQKILANRSATPKAAENSGLELELEEDEQDESASENTSEAAQKSDVPQKSDTAKDSDAAQKSNVSQEPDAVKNSDAAQKSNVSQEVSHGSGTIWFQSFSDERLAGKKSASGSAENPSEETELFSEKGSEKGFNAGKSGTDPLSAAANGTGSGEFSYFHKEQSDSNEKQRPPFWESPWWGLLIVLGISAGLILLASHLIRKWSTPPEADVLYARIIEAAEDEDAENSSDFSKDVETFLICYSRDPRAEKVQEFQSDIDLNRLEKRLLLNTRGRQFHSVLPIERDYLDAVADLQSRPELTLKKLEDFIIFYDSVCGTLRKTDTFSPAEMLKMMRYLEIAKRQQFRIRRVVEKERTMRRELLNQEIEHVRALLRSADPEEREQGQILRQSMLDLYEKSDPEGVAPLLEMEETE